MGGKFTSTFAHLSQRIAYMLKNIKLTVPIFLIVFFITACETTFPPTLTTPSTAQVIASTEPTLVPAIPTVSTPIVWSTYRNDTYGFTFEYPAAYDNASYKDSCGIKESNDGIHLGHQIDLLFLESNGLDLTEYANTLLQSKGWTSTSLINATTDGLERVTVEYRFGGLNRFGKFTLIKSGAHIFALNFTAGSFCDIPEASLSEPEVYSHVLETFRLTTTVTSNPTSD